MIVVLKTPSRRAAHREGQVRDRTGGAPLDGRGLRRPAAGSAPARTPRAHHPPRLQLRPGPRRVLRRARPESRGSARAQLRGRRRLPGAGRLPRRARRAAGGSRNDAGRPRRRAAGLRRRRDHGGAARHGRRPLAALPRRTGRAGNRRRRRDRGRRRRSATRRTSTRSSGTAPSSQACSSAPAVPTGSTASRPAQPCCRSGSPAGSRPPTAARPSMQAATS